MLLRWRHGLTATALAVLLSPVASAQNSVPATSSIPNTLTVQGYGVAYSTADTVIMSGNINEQVPSPSRGVADIQAALARLRAALAKLGISSQDITTTFLNMWGNGPYQFNVNAGINILLPSIDLVGKVAEAALKAGVNNIGSITFSVRHPGAAVNQALGQALAQARRRAEALAQDLGVTLGPVVSVEETTNNGTVPNPGPIYYGPGAPVYAYKGNGGLGTAAVTVAVTVTYRFATK